MEYFNIFTHIILIMSLGWYLITNLQWYNYSLERVISKHHKWQWHITYFLLPIVLFYILDNIYFLLYFYLLYLTSFVFWNMKLTKSLVLTSRVKRFLAILLFITFAFEILFLSLEEYNISIIFAPLLLAYAVSSILENMFFISFKHNAKVKLKTFTKLQTILITGSYGKTSIKNYLYQVLKNKYNVHKTPRSVNTITGILVDVNTNLNNKTQIYIAEAGARQKGDIKEITMFLKPTYCIIGSVGEQHIEYFKTLDNIIHTKMEILQSPSMIKGFVHNSVPIKEYDKIVKFPNNLNVTMSNLDGLWFTVIVNGKDEDFYAPVLGSFNAINLTAVILLAYELGISIEEIRNSIKNIKSIAHRLELSKANDKIIIDDSFNGNLEGMLEAIKICSSYEGRKVIITPGLVESTSDANALLAQSINENFDYVILTGTLNISVLKEYIDETKTFILKDKNKLEETLIDYTKKKDLILFANDAPNFI